MITRNKQGKDTCARSINLPSTMRGLKVVGFKNINVCICKLTHFSKNKL